MTLSKVFKIWLAKNLYIHGEFLHQLWNTHSFRDISLDFVTKGSSVSMQFYSYMSIRLHSILCQTSIIACLRLHVAVLEDLQKGGGARWSRIGCIDAGSSARSCASKWE